MFRAPETPHFLGLWGAPNADKKPPRTAGRSSGFELGSAPSMATKFAQFLQDNKIDPRRIIVASAELERLRPEDRAIRLKKRTDKKAGTKLAEGEKPTKPRSGHAVTPRLLESVSVGKPVSGPAKTRLLRALNHVLTTKKKTAVELKALF